MSRTTLGDEDVRRPIQHTTTKAARKMWVACKLPSGLQLQTFHMVDDSEPQRDGSSRSIKRAEPDEGVFVCRGTALPAGTRVDYIIGGYAITYGCPHELWEKWLHHYGKSHLVQRELIHAEETREGLEDWCRKRRTVRSGMEPVDPAKPHLVTPGTRFKVERGVTDNSDVEEAALSER